MVGCGVSHEALGENGSHWNSSCVCVCERERERERERDGNQQAKKVTLSYVTLKTQVFD